MEDFLALTVPVLSLRDGRLEWLWSRSEGSATRQCVTSRWIAGDGSESRGMADQKGNRVAREGEIVSHDAFVWKRGRAQVTLTREGAHWVIVYTVVGRLLGPRQVLYHGSHREATHAAWDVMARVVRACRDEEEGLRVGRAAAQWIKANPVAATSPVPRRSATER